MQNIINESDRRWIWKKTHSIILSPEVVSVTRWILEWSIYGANRVILLEDSDKYSAMLVWPLACNALCFLVNFNEPSANGP